MALTLAMPWMLVAVGILILAAIVVGLLLGLRRGPEARGDSGALVARAERVRALPSFARAVRRRRAALVGVIVLGLAASALAAVIAARPVTAQTIQPENNSRDVMLCLDVSGSMSDVDVEVLTVFEELIEGFEGERIGLTIFNSSPVQVFPLTDDYAFVQAQLQRIRESFDYLEEIPEHWVGTLNGPGASLIGDGLASCAMRFDHVDEERARSIILATDNELNGESVITLDEAAAFTASRGIRLYTINPVDGIAEAESTALSDAAAMTGGIGFGLRDATTVDEIIDEVQKQEASTLRGEATVIQIDTPQLWIVALMIVVLGFLLVLWRVRL